jgi:deoxycytidine triphosphate deaminase
MYLADNELTALVPSMEISSDAEPFDEKEQIRSASLDLRLSEVFWIPRKRWTVDLRRRKLMEIQPRRYYAKRTLRKGESIVLRPGALLLARTSERFTIPNGYVGELIGRSSFARIGLQVTSTGGFINPGWRGHMPLQLINHGPNPIRLVAGLHLCQVRIAQLSSRSSKPYDHEQLRSLYVDDDGGPSYWWRDKRIQALHDKLAEFSVEERIQNALYRTMGHCEPEVIERLEYVVSRMRVAEAESADAILEIFAKKEERRRKLRQWSINAARAVFGLGVAITFLLLRADREWWHSFGYAAALVFCALSIYAFRTDVGEHFGRAEHARARREEPGKERSTKGS